MWLCLEMEGRTPHGRGGASVARSSGTLLFAVLPKHKIAHPLFHPPLLIHPTHTHTTLYRANAMDEDDDGQPRRSATPTLLLSAAGPPPPSLPAAAPPSAANADDETEALPAAGATAAPTAMASPPLDVLQVGEVWRRGFQGLAQSLKCPICLEYVFLISLPFPPIFTPPLFHAPLHPLPCRSCLLLMSVTGSLVYRR